MFNATYLCFLCVMDTKRPCSHDRSLNELQDITQRTGYQEHRLDDHFCIDEILLSELTGKISCSGWIEIHCPFKNFHVVSHY